MKKIYIFLLVLAVSLTLAACGNTKKEEQQVIEAPVNEGNMQEKVDTKNEPDESTSPNVNGNETITVNQEDMQKKMDELNYLDFELEVEYANYQEYEAELERESDISIKSKIEDSVNNVKVNGSDAFNELYPLVKQLTITQQTTKDEAIQGVLATFNLPDDYQKFEMDIKLKDGTSLEFEDRK